MEIRSLYAYAENHDISILNCDLPQTRSMSVMLDNGACFVGMDKTVLDGGCRERVHLGHELGHCATGSFYSIYTAVDSRRRHENRADKWAVKKIIPVEELDGAIAEGCTEIWELAERFGVTEAFMRKAVCYYVHGNLATELYF